MQTLDRPTADAAGGLIGRYQVLPVKATRGELRVVAFGVFGGNPWRQIALVSIDDAGGEAQARAIADEIAGKAGAIFYHPAVEDLRGQAGSEVYDLLKRCDLADAWPPPPVRIRRAMSTMKRIAREDVEQPTLF